MTIPQEVAALLPVFLIVTLAQYPLFQSDGTVISAVIVPSGLTSAEPSVPLFSSLCDPAPQASRLHASEAEM
ncbi:hypothetical protein BE04_30095 [Sorangium cellulosum]|uniref:Uncharacterized protein n=2 Tax=Sorangium cellulosum TaxID=56 RepID=A0A150QG96_SORCE|nr:hypothetical protein SCE1572_09540 [Sorangium cellulosum So0157-2]KYF66756.1 hypothetical protein BE04_30095 [Sorangium cellulosum]KYG06657.1 hypothetical protein BE21_33590 [Sorangium cellulosum]